MSRVLVAALVVISVGLAAPASARDDERMLILTSEGSWAEAEARVIAELGTLGMRAERVRHDGAEEHAEPVHDMVERMGATGAMAVRRISPRMGQVHVWLDDAPVDRESTRRIELPGGTEDGAAEFALQAVELLRASLIELRSTRRQGGRRGEEGRALEVELLTDESPEAGPGARRARPAAERGGVGIGLSGLGLVSATPLVSLRPYWAPTHALRLHVDMGVTWAPPWVELEPGRAEVSMARAGVGASWHVWRFETWSAFTSLTAGSTWVWSSETSGALRAGGDLAQVGMVQPELGVSWHVLPRLRMTTCAGAGVLLPKLVLAAPGTQQTSRAFWSLGLSLEWLFGSN